MAAAKLLDDPDHINAFLSMIGASITTHRIGTASEDEKNEKDDEQLGNEQVISDDKENENPTTPGLDLNKEPAAGAVTPEVRSRAQSTTSSPVMGTKAPPPTPVNTVATTEPAGKLEPIDEDETDVLVKLAQDSKLGLTDSKFAHKLYHPVAEHRPGVGNSYQQRIPSSAEIPPSCTPKIKKDMLVEDPRKDYMDQVVSDLKKQQHINDTKNEDEALKAQPAPADNPLTPSKVTYDAATPVKQLEKVSQDVKIAESKSSAEAAARDSSLTQAQEATAGIDDPEIVEDRACLTQLKSWGKPEARDKPAARVRRLALSDLPVDADLTLVQSLVHGGSIDDMILMGASQVAYVRFTSGDACDTYCAKYPNGLKFKYKGRSYTVFVEKCKDVDVISGMLQGYIDCGASRCVRAIGADEDWGMGALKRLAEGKSRKRNVENITDVYRNGIRTIVFRFTSIGEAVAFKSMLIRDEDWEGCNIQFAADPCEKATAVHLE